MKYFETVGRALDAQVPALAEDLGIPVTDLYQRMSQALPLMTREWSKGSAPAIPYNDPVYRLAYVFCHVAINANLVQRALEDRFTDPRTGRETSLGQWVRAAMESQGRLRVCAFGGGPGTELLALSKYLVHYPLQVPHADLELTLLDQVSEWAETLEALKEAIYSQYPAEDPRPFSIGTSVHPFDMTRLQNYGTLGTLLRRDLFILNYVVSEVFDQSRVADLAKVVKLMRDKSPEATFLLLDRSDPRTREVAADIISRAGLAVLDERMVGDYMDLDEQSSRLDAHAVAMGRNPRVKWYGDTGASAAFFIVAR